VAICAGVFLAVAEVDPWFSREFLALNWSVGVPYRSELSKFAGSYAGAARWAES